MDLVRAILLVTESHEKESLGHTEVIMALGEQFPQITSTYEQLVAHVEMMYEAGLIETNIQETFQEKFFTSLRLTWEGHEFIANARNEDVWAETKEKSGDASFTVIKLVLAELVKRTLGL